MHPMLALNYVPEDGFKLFQRVFVVVVLVLFVCFVSHYVALATLELRKSI